MLLQQSLFDDDRRQLGSKPMILAEIIALLGGAIELQLRENGTDEAVQCYLATLDDVLEPFLVYENITSFLTEDELWTVLKFANLRAKFAYLRAINPGQAEMRIHGEQLMYKGMNPENQASMRSVIDKYYGAVRELGMDKARRSAGSCFIHQWDAVLARLLEANRFSVTASAEELRKKRSMLRAGRNALRDIQRQIKQENRENERYGERYQQLVNTYIKSTLRVLNSHVLNTVFVGAPVDMAFLKAVIAKLRSPMVEWSITVTASNSEVRVFVQLNETAITEVGNAPDLEQFEVTTDSRKLKSA